MKSQKHTYRLLVAATALSCVSAFAGNGNYTPGATPISQSMGGSGVGFFTTNADALTRNPALMTQSSVENKFEISGWAGMHTLDARTEKENVTMTNSKKSTFVPGGAVSYRINDRFVVGLGYFALGGNNIDHTGNSSVSRIQNKFELSRLLIGTAYKVSEQVSVGIAPFVNYGEYQLNVSTGSGDRSRNGSKEDMGLGYQLAVSYSPIKALNLGFSYVSKTKQTYDSVTDLHVFGGVGSQPNPDPIVIDAPNEFVLGSSYKFTESFAMTFDVRRINWGDTAGYKDLGWESQNIFMLGGQYAVTEKWKFRLGFNYAKSPQGSVTGEAGTGKVPVSGISVFKVVVSRLNAAGYPAYIEKLITAGTGYQITPNLAVNVAYIFGLSGDISRAGSALGVDPTTTYNYKGTSETQQFNVGANYTF